MMCADRNHGDVISTFIGWDTLIFSALAEGAAGVMAGTGSVVPAQLVAVHDAVVAGDLAGGRAAWERVYPLLDAIMEQPFISGVKTALQAAGFDTGVPRAPLHALDQQSAARIVELASALAPQAVGA